MSILNGFSKVYERFINDSMLPIIQTFLSNFVSSYRKHYSANHVLIILIENWKKNLDNNKVVGAVLYICQKLLIAYLMIYLSPKWKPMGSVRTSLLFCIHT